MELQLLGPVEATVDGRPIPLGATKQRALLAMLALRANSTVSIDALIEGLWAGDPPATAAKMVQLYVSQLRRLLDSNGAEIVTQGRGYELRLNADGVDAIRFERAVSEADAEALRGALALWHGAPLANVAEEPFAPAAIRRLEELRLQATELAIDADLAAGRHREVLGELETLIAEYPLSERFHAQRMLALYRSGRQADALEAYRHARHVLVEEIGVEPGPELRELHDAILRQDGEALDLPRVRPRPPPAPPAEETEAVPSRRSRWLVLAAALSLLAGATVFAVTRLTGPDSLPRIDENWVGLIDSEGRITDQYPVGRNPGAVVAGGGSMWVANTQDGTVTRIPPDREHTVTIPIGGSPTGMVFDAGALWIADGDSRSVRQLDPGANTLGRSIDVGNAPRALAAGYGALWAASAADSAVRRVDLRTGTSRTIPLGSSATAIAAGAGAIWVASEESRTVSRIEPQSGTVRTISVSSPQSAVAVGEGAVWVASRDDGTLSRIDPKTNAVSWTIPVGGDPGAIATGDGAVWIVAENAGTVTRVDPRDRHVLDPVAVKGSPAGIAVADGTAWVTAGAPAASHRGGTLRVLFTSGVPPPKTFPIDWLDPYAYNPYSPEVYPLAYDGLVAYRRVGGPFGSTLVGALATSAPAPIDGGLAYVFTLRPGLRFSNGRAVRPEDFRASMERFMQVTRTDGFPAVFAGIVGAERCMGARNECHLSQGIETDAQARTITVHLTKPDSDFLHKLTQSWAYVVPSDLPRRRFGDRMPPGTGPYRVAAWDSRRGGHLVRNPYFRGRSDRPAGFADRIEAHIDPPSQTAAQIAQVQRGAADVAPIGSSGYFYPASKLLAVEAASPGQVVSLPTWVVETMALNVRRAPFDDVDVRRALNYATDRARVVEVAGGTQAMVPTCQILPTGFPAHEPYCPYTARAGPGRPWSAPDMERARRLVARSGTAGQRVEVRVPDWKPEVGRYFEQLLDDLGYRASLRVVPAAEFDFSNRTGQISFGGWGADYLAPSGLIPPIFDCATGPTHFCLRRYTGRLQEALAAEGREARVRWAAIDRLLTDLAPTVPLTNPRNLFIISKRAGNVRGSAFGPLYDQMWVR